MFTHGSPHRNNIHDYVQNTEFKDLAYKLSVVSVVTVQVRIFKNIAFLMCLVSSVSLCVYNA